MQVDEVLGLHILRVIIVDMIASLTALGAVLLLAAHTATVDFVTIVFFEYDLLPSSHGGERLV